MYCYCLYYRSKCGKYLTSTAITVPGNFCWSITVCIADYEIVFLAKQMVYQLPRNTANLVIVIRTEPATNLLYIIVAVIISVSWCTRLKWLRPVRVPLLQCQTVRVNSKSQTRWSRPRDWKYSISQEICTRFCCALLCCGYAIVHNEFTWRIYPYSSGLFCWHWGNR